MKVQSKREIEVTLTMTEQEAKWLRGLVQNPLVKDNFPVDYESSEDAEMRQVFFAAVDSGLKMGLT